MKFHFFLAVLRSALPSMVGALLFEAGSSLAIAQNEAPVAVTLTGVQHLGSNFSISEFYINDHYGSNVGRNGGGGKFVCCVSLPQRWKPGLVGRVRWSVLDWSAAVTTELDAGNYKSIVLEGEYIATVPIEKYDGAGNLYAHFFPNGKIRLVSSDHLVINEKHPIRFNDSSAVDLATAGTRIPQAKKESAPASGSKEEE